MRKTRAIVALTLAFTLTFAGTANAGPVLDRILITVKAPFTFEPIGIAIQEGDPLLVNWAENFLSALDGSGDLKKMAERWFQDGSWLSELP